MTGCPVTAQEDEVNAWAAEGPEQTYCTCSVAFSHIISTVTVYS